jgi:16S rRNA processing protein RimM
VVDKNGLVLGTVSDVLQTGSNDVYAVKTLDGGELLLPAIESAVHSIDIAQGRMIVTVPEYW